MANNKDILLVVRAETKDADEKLGKIDDKLNDIQDSGSTAGDILKETGSRIDDIGESSETAGASLGTLGTVIGVGLVAGLTVASLALVGLIKDFYESDGAVKNVTEKIKAHWTEVYTATTEWEKFGNEIKKFDEIQIEESIKGINLRLMEIEAMISSSGGNAILDFFGYWDDEVNLLNKSLEKLNSQKFESFKKNVLEPLILGSDWGELVKSGIFERAEKLANSWTKIKEETGKANKELLDYFNMINKIMDKEKIDDPQALGDTYYLGHGYGGANNKNRSSKNTMATGAFTQEYTQNLELIKDLTKSAADVLRSEFGSAWESIFGEANSLFEKLMMNWAEMLANRGLNSLFGSFLNFLVPGSGTVYEAATNKSTPMVVNVNLGNETLARAVVKGNYEAQRLRLNN